jgi:hypothetical protein
VLFSEDLGAIQSTEVEAGVDIGVLFERSAQLYATYSASTDWCLVQVNSIEFRLYICYSQKLGTRVRT